MAEGLDGLAQPEDLAVDGDGECDGGYPPLGAWFSPQWFSFQCDTLIDHIQLKQYISPRREYVFPQKNFHELHNDLTSSSLRHF